jgi:hypothetical protein
MKKYIRQIIQLQRNIITTFKRVYPEVKDYNLLLDCPREGKLEINGQIWLFIKHGKGLKFIRKEPVPKIIVDIHNYFSEPNVLDEWRLKQYIESLNLTYSTSEINNSLHELTLTHFLKKISEQQYKLNELK